MKKVVLLEKVAWNRVCLSAFQYYWKAEKGNFEEKPIFEIILKMAGKDFFWIYVLSSNIEIC